MKVRIVFYLFAVLWSGCHLRGQKQGIIKVHVYLFGSDSSITKPPLDIGYKIFFKNNQSIQEVPLIVSTSDPSGQKTSVRIKHYSYLDPDENICYNYSSFSDTAKVLKHYSDIDSIEIDGGWNFLSNKKFEYDSLMTMNDTVISNITYGRIRLGKKNNDVKIYFVLYLRCDKKGTLIKIFKPLSDSIGCPIVRDETFIKNKLFMTREIEFISDKLSKNELSTFDAWGKK